MLNWLMDSLKHYITQYNCLMFNMKWDGQLNVCDVGPKWPSGAARGALGSVGSVALSDNKVTNGRGPEAHLLLHGPHNTTCRPPACIHLTPRCCQTKAGSPPPGTCQHSSRVEPRALMPHDRQGTTR